MPRSRIRAGLRVAGRAGWGVGDQALSSLSNFAIGLVVARSVSPAAFGAFSLAFATYLLALSASRAVGTEPLAVRVSGRPEAEWRAAVRKVSGLAVGVGVVFGLVCVLAGAAVGGPAGRTFLVLGLLMPALLLQDVWRGAFFAAGRGGHAMANDSIWVVALVPAFAMLFAIGGAEPAAFVAAWGSGAVVAALAGIAQAKVLPAVQAGHVWLREQWGLSSRYLLEFLALTGSLQLYVFGVGAISGLAAVGALRAGLLLLGPLNIVVMGIGMMVVPEAVRALNRSLDRLVLLSRLVSVGLTTAVLCWGAIVLLIPAEVGERIFADAWEPARSVVLPLILMQAFANARTGALVALRAFAAAGRSLRARLVTSAFFIIGALVGAWIDGAVGAAWGLAAGAALSDFVWWREMRAETRYYRNPPRHRLPRARSGQVVPADGTG